MNSQKRVVMGAMRKWSAVLAVSLGSIVSSIAIAGTITYYHNDLLGSPVAATNATGQVIWRESYRPYGERIKREAGSSENKVWYTSRRQDVETGLVYMGARYYDPIVGRFMGVDPKAFDEANTHSFNRYEYANNNPYRYRDPDGRQAVQAAVVGGLAIGVFILVPEKTKQDMALSTMALIRHLQNTFNENADETDKGAKGGGKSQEPADSSKPATRPKDVPDRGEPGSVREGERRTREYGPDGRPLRDYDKPHQGYERPHVHEWQDGVREHPGRDYSPLPRKEE